MKNILLIDDDIDILKSTGEILNGLGYEVIAKSDGRSALSVIREGTCVNLVITDHQLPVMDGIEIACFFKQCLPFVPVIILSEEASIESYLKSLSCGVFEYMNKPVRVKELKKIVEKALERFTNATASVVTRNSRTSQDS